MAKINTRSAPVAALPASAAGSGADGWRLFERHCYSALTGARDFDQARAACAALGAHLATVTNAEELMHGKTSRITHDDSDFYDGVPQPFTATRYHSLAVVDGTMPPELVITSRTQGGVIMGLRHESAPIYGVQFHPESVLTEGGYRMLGNWLAVSGLPEARERAVHLNPLVRIS